MTIGKFNSSTGEWSFQDETKWDKWKRKLWHPLEQKLVWLYQHWLYVLVGGLFLALCFAVILAPDLFARLGADAESETSASGAQRQALLLFLGGILAAVTAWLSVLRHRRETEALEIERDRHWTSRYTEAVTQLGNDSTTINSGGVYALERLALETDKHEDAQMVANLLSAYVVDKADGRDEDFRAGREYNRKVPAILRAVFKSLDIIQRKQGVRTYFPGLVLPDLKLSGVQLRKADFSRADLMRSTFSRCKFERAFFVETKLTDSSLASSDFTLAYLMDADFSRSNLTQVDFTEAKLGGASLRSANVSSAKFDFANLNGTDLSELTGWEHAQLEKAGRWDANTLWPEGFRPSTKTKPTRKDFHTNSR